jgi:hypothetical protein
MAIDQFIIGDDGDATFKVGTTTSTLFKVRSYAATLSRNSVDLTAFGDTGRRKRLGMLDVTGSLNAIMGIDKTATPITNSFYSSQQLATTDVVELTLKLSSGTAATNQAKIVATVVFNSFAFNSDKSGEATMSVNFENSSGAAPVVTWLV